MSVEYMDPFRHLASAAFKNAAKPASPEAVKARQANAKAKLNAALALYKKQEAELAKMARGYNNAAAKLRTAANNAARAATAVKKANARSPSPRRVRIGIQPPVLVTTKFKNGRVTRETFYRTRKGFYEVKPNGTINYSKPVHKK